MNTSIEGIATVFGWTEADYSKNNSLDYYRTHASRRRKPKLHILPFITM